MWAYFIQPRASLNTPKTICYLLPPKQKLMQIVPHAHVVI